MGALVWWGLHALTANPLGTVLAALLGVLFGSLTGLVPGLHVNLFAAAALSSLALLTSTGLALPVGVFLICLGIAQGIVGVIPTVFLGAADEESCVSVLPGLEMLQAGFGYEAVRLWVQGCLIGLLLGSLLLPPLLHVLPALYAGVKPLTGFVLLWISFHMLWSGSWRGRLANMVVFCLSGMLGIIAFTQKGISEPVFPLMSGLFGCANLVLTSGSASRFPEQHFRPVITLAKATWSKVIAAASLSSLLLALFPGIGRSQSSAISLAAVGKLPSAASLSLLGMISTMGTVVSIAALLSIHKARDGVVIALGSLLDMESGMWPALLALVLMAGAIAAPITLLLGRWTLPVLQRLPRRVLAYAVLLLVSVLVFLLSGPYGLLVLIAATALGVLCDTLGVKRRMLLGSLLLPVLSYWFL